MQNLKTTNEVRFTDSKQKYVKYVQSSINVLQERDDIIEKFKNGFTLCNSCKLDRFYFLFRRVKS